VAGSWFRWRPRPSITGDTPALRITDLGIGHTNMHVDAGLLDASTSIGAGKLTLSATAHREVFAPVGEYMHLLGIEEEPASPKVVEAVATSPICSVTAASAESSAKGSNEVTMWLRL
jgi:hypothetical protein